MGKFLLVTPPITQGFDQRPKGLGEAQKCLGKGQGPPLELEVSPLSRLYLLFDWVPTGLYGWDMPCLPVYHMQRLQAGRHR